MRIYENDDRDNELDEYVTYLLVCLGGRKEQARFFFTKKAIIYYFKLDRYVRLKELYEMLAKDFGKSPSAIQGNVRHFVDQICENARNDNICAISFLPTGIIDESMYVNRFISLMVEQVKKRFFLCDGKLMDLSDERSGK